MKLTRNENKRKFSTSLKAIPVWVRKSSWKCRWTFKVTTAVIFLVIQIVLLRKKLFPLGNCHSSHSKQKLPSHHLPSSFPSCLEPSISVITSLQLKMNSFDILQWQPKLSRSSSMLHEVLHLTCHLVDMELQHFQQVARAKARTY